jgi:hypothetical protein
MNTRNKIVPNGNGSRVAAGAGFIRARSVSSGYLGALSPESGTVRAQMRSRDDPRPDERWSSRPVVADEGQGGPRIELGAGGERGVVRRWIAALRDECDELIFLSRLVGGRRRPGPAGPW